MLAQRTAKNVSTLLANGENSAEIVAALGKDANTFRELMTSLEITDAESKRKFGELEACFKAYQEAMVAFAGNLAQLTNARQVVGKIADNSENLLNASDNLAKGFSSNQRRTSFLWHHACGTDSFGASGFGDDVQGLP